LQDREPGTEPLSLVREGDAYIVTVEELITPEVFGLPSVAKSSSSSDSAPQSPTSPTVVQKSPVAASRKSDPPSPSKRQQAPVKETEEDKPQQGVRFEPGCKKSPEPQLPFITVDLPSPVRLLKDKLQKDDSVPPPFQAEETELACGNLIKLPSESEKYCQVN
jgi:hypothetical protein